MNTLDVDNVFRERNPKETALLLKLSNKQKQMIDDVARELDMETSVFIRRAIEREIVRSLDKINTKTRSI